MYCILTSEIKNLKNEVINVKDEMMKMKAVKKRELGKQLEDRMKNASMPDNNRKKSREKESGSNEIKVESINPFKSNGITTLINGTSPFQFQGLLVNFFFSF